MAFIKNIEHETVLPLAEQVTVQPGQIVSRTLAQNKAVSVTLFAFDRAKRSVPMTPPAMLWYRYWKEKENLQ